MRLPALDAFGHLSSFQFDDTVCQKIELRMYECAEAYGQYRAHKMCADLFDDAKECRTHEKQKPMDSTVPIKCVRICLMTLKNVE